MNKGLYSFLDSFHWHRIKKLFESQKSLKKNEEYLLYIRGKSRIKIFQSGFESEQRKSPAAVIRQVRQRLNS